MQLLTLATAAATLLTSAAAFTPASTAGTDALYKKGVANLAKYQKSHPSASNCTAETTYVRKEWYDLDQPREVCKADLTDRHVQGHLESI